MNFKQIINEAILGALVEDNFELPDLNAKRLKIVVAAAKKHKLKTKIEKGSKPGLSIITVMGNTKQIDKFMGSLHEEEDVQERIIRTGIQTPTNPNLNKPVQGIQKAPRLNKRKPFKETTIAATKRGVNVTGVDGKTRTVMKTTKIKNYDGEQDKIRSGKSKSVWDKE